MGIGGSGRDLRVRYTIVQVEGEAFAIGLDDGTGLEGAKSGPSLKREGVGEWMAARSGGGGILSCVGVDVLRVAWEALADGRDD